MVTYELLYDHSEKLAKNKINRGCLTLFVSGKTERLKLLISNDGKEFKLTKAGINEDRPMLENNVIAEGFLK